MTASPTDLLREATSRLDRIAAEAESGALDEAIALLVGALDADGVIHAFGTGHSEAFSMEIAGRAGGLIPTNRFTLRDIVLKLNTATVKFTQDTKVKERLEPLGYQLESSKPQELHAQLKSNVLHVQKFVNVSTALLER